MNPAANSLVISFLIASFLSGENHRRHCLTGFEPGFKSNLCSANSLGTPGDEDINPDMGMATPTEPAQAPPGPLTRARARELNFVMILKNEGPEVS